MSDVAEVGHNGPPSPMEMCASDFSEFISEAENWGDGEIVTTLAQMEAVDAVIKGLKSYGTALNKAVAEYTGPAHKVWKGKVAEGKAYTDDKARLQSVLVAAVSPFKEKLAAEKEAERKAAWEAARQAEREAEELAAKANAVSIEDVRAAEDAKASAMEAKKLASSAQKDTVKGMRDVHRHEVVSMRDLVNWIAINDKAAMAHFANTYAGKNHKNIPDDVVRSWTEKEAF